MSDEAEYQLGPGRRTWRMPDPSGQRISQWKPARCGWHDCQCTHEPPCVSGWIDGDVPVLDRDGKQVLRPNGKPVTRAVARPCPNCRPEHHKTLNDQSLERPQQMGAIRRLKER